MPEAHTPAAITKDCDATLQKGVRLWMDKAQVVVPVIEDIGHVMAAALKAQFEHRSDFKRFATLAAKAAKSLRQTELAFLIPPKLRSKGHFLSIGKLARWGEKMLGVLAVKGRARKGSPLAKLRAALPGFLALRAFVEIFASTAVTVSQVMETLKNKGLERSPQADMNRTVLLIPALCGNPDAATISSALAHTRHGDLVAWEQESIPYTMRKKRQAFFAFEQANKR